MLRRVSELEELEQRAALLELTTDVVSSATPDGRVIHLNAAGRKLLGWKTESLSKKRIEDAHPARVVDRLRDEVLPRVAREGQWRGETAVLDAEGNEVPVAQEIVAHFDDSGRVVGLSTILRDLRERKASEQRLREATQRFQLVLDYIPQFVFWKDRRSVYLGCNRNFAEVAGVHSVEDIVGKTDYDLAWKREEAEFFRTVDEQVMSADKAQSHIEEPQLQADGKQAWLDTSKIPLHDEAGNVVGILGMYEDITERKAAQERLFQAQKLESIGQLAGGVAHDVNNMLTVIAGAAQMLAEDTADQPALRALAGDILDATQQASGLTQRLLDFSRSGTQTREPVDINAIVRSAVALLKRTVDRKIDITTGLDARENALRGDPSQLQNMVLNLGLNARDAMSDGGELHLASENFELEAGDPRLDGASLRPGPYVALTVRDQGTGMTAEVAARAFEPFFTTKRVGSGTGLGLAAVYSAVVDHGGTVEIQSAPGHGTTVVAWLPVEPGLEVPAALLPNERPRGTGQILVVDDEAMVRVTATKMLVSLGYEVIAVEDGIRAVEMIRTGEVCPDLVLLDMVMPKIDGRQTLATLREAGSDVPVVFCSGYSREFVDVVDSNVLGFEKKPYQLSHLAQQVATAIARHRATS